MTLSLLRWAILAQSLTQLVLPIPVRVRIMINKLLHPLPLYYLFGLGRGVHCAGPKYLCLLQLDVCPPTGTLAIVSGCLPSSTTASSKFDNKDGSGIDKLDGVDKKGDHGIDELGNLNKKDGHTAKKPRLASPTFSDKVLNKFGLPFISVQNDAAQHGASPPANHINRSLRRDGENKDSLRKLPASRSDRLRPPCLPTESHARERERSRSLDK